MQPLGANKRQKKMDEILLADAMRGTSAYEGSQKRQLPRLARRAIRFVRGLTPRRLVASKTVKVLTLGLVVIGASGYFIKTTDENSVIASATSHMGFEASKLVLNGNKNLNINVLQARLATQLGKSLFSFEVDAARDAVMSDPWVRSATVKKAYPDTIVIDVVERVPVALWQSKGELHLIAPDGFVIGKADQKHMHLPQVVGDGANMAAAEFLSVIGKFPTVSQKASAYVRVAGRRWNVRLANGPQVLLPEFDWQYALSDLQDLQSNQELLDRDLVQIDMRLPDRLVIKLDPEMADIRKTTIQKSLKRDWHKS